MRVCHVITRLIIGGAQENTVLTCMGLAQRGHDVFLIAGPETGPEGSLWDDARQAGCEVICLNSLRRSIHPVLDMRARSELVEIFRELKPDIVHTHSSKAGILGRSAARKASSPIVVHTIHGMSFNRTQSALTRAAYRFLERRAATNSNAIVAVAQAMIDQAVEARIAPRDLFALIRSGMETKHYFPSDSDKARLRVLWGYDDECVVVGTVARLFDNKGYEEIMQAMRLSVSRCPNLRFVWVGDGANRRQYESTLSEMGLRGKVRFEGLVAPQRVGELMRGFDMLVHASRWEGLPRAVVQALLTGVPVISFDNDGAPEVVKDGETGCLVPLGDCTRLAEAITYLAEKPDTRTRLGRRGREVCLEMFDWKRMTKEIETLYVRLMSEK